MQNELLETVKSAKNASYELAATTTETRNNALVAVAEAIESNKDAIFEANKKDLEAAKELVENGKISKSMFNRLKLDENKMRDMIAGIYDVIKLEDPVNKCLLARELDEGLSLYKVTCPIGLICVIFEARPDVIAQIASLCIKSANAVILKGGSEGVNTNKKIAEIINVALSNVENFPKNVVNLVFSREEIAELLKLDEYIDLVIPRGSNKLVKYIKSNTNIPVLGHADGICHIYIDEFADIKKALNICLDAKIQYPSACNAVETILVNKNVVNDFVPKMIETFKQNDVKVIGDEVICKFDGNIQRATEDDWKTEYGDKIVSLKVVNSITEAIVHVNKYGSHHTDCIITENAQNAATFMNFVDSAGVYQNASTRFADGFRYGFGAEVGISTSKTHARGPVGLEGLVIYKYKLFGNGQIVQDYCSGKKKFTHKNI